MQEISIASLRVPMDINFAKRFMVSQVRGMDCRVATLLAMTLR